MVFMQNFGGRGVPAERCCSECKPEDCEKRFTHVCIFVSPCVGGSKVPPRTLYRIKCVLAEILYGCQKQNGGFYENSCAKPANISNTRY